MVIILREVMGMPTLTKIQTKLLHKIRRMQPVSKIRLTLFNRADNEAFKVLAELGLIEVCGAGFLGQTWRVAELNRIKGMVHTTAKPLKSFVVGEPLPEQANRDS